MENTICLYHANCLDGFASAYAVDQSMKNETVEYIPIQYGTDCPDVVGKNVIMVDFSFKKEEMLKIIELANDVLVIDHHKTAEEELKDLLKEGLIRGIFDMNKSGAVLTWEWFHNTPVPELFYTIQDRDLWRFELPNTRAINAALFSYPMEFCLWGKLLETPLETFVIEGTAIDRFHLKNVNSIVKNVNRGTVAGYSTPMVCCNGVFASDCGNILAVNEPFSCTYFDIGDKRIFSLRSKEDGLDVSLIAKSFKNGGGHKHAAGFSLYHHELHLLEKDING